MIARLENGGYTHGEFFKDSRSLTEEGVGLLERVILEAFLENPGLTQRFSRDVGLNLNQILQKYVKEYLGMKEEHLYGRRFS